MTTIDPTGPITLINAPCNLGLRPLRPGHLPGAWRAPAVLEQAGIRDAIGPSDLIEMERPQYSAEAQPGTNLLNGPALRAFNLELAGHVEQVLGGGGRPFVIGGDCSILLGALAGARRHGPLSLVHIDGHSDFRHPGNYDAEASLGAVAGMDLALATGRGEELLTSWPGVNGPLVSDENVIQIGEREGRDADFAWPDVNDTAITRIDVFRARELGAPSVLAQTLATLDKTDFPFWVHIDIDVLDMKIMPAVDCPGSPGIDPPELVTLLSALVRDGRFIGLTLTIYDPDLDPSGECAQLIVNLLHAVRINVSAVTE